MTNKHHIAYTLIISGLIIAGLAYFAAQRNTPPELLLSDEGTPIDLEGPLTPEEQEVTNVDITNTMNPIARVTTNLGVIDLELFADQMPITTGNFITLAEDGFYDGVKFHRVIPGFMIQGGDPLTKEDDNSVWGTGGSENIPDEFVEGELLTNIRGTIAMANTGQPNSGSSQFFINLGDNSPLDFDDPRQPASRHPVFGRVVEGLDVVDTIGTVETGARDIPVEPVVIQSVEIIPQ